MKTKKSFITTDRAAVRSGDRMGVHWLTGVPTGSREGILGVLGGYFGYLLGYWGIDRMGTTQSTVLKQITI